MSEKVNKILVAVYGSLKRGFSNHRLLTGEGAKYAYEGLTLPEYSMVSFGGYPGAFAGDSRILVEVYEVDKPTLATLDSLEGHPSFYRRSPTTIQIDENTNIIAWMYTLNLDNRPANYAEQRLNNRIKPNQRGVLVWEQPYKNMSYN